MHTMRKNRGGGGRENGPDRNGSENDVGNLFGKPGRNQRRNEQTFRQVREGETFEDALKDEMNLRGHNNEDAAREIPTSPANVSRWLRGVQIPTYGSAQSAQNIAHLVRYLRLTHLSEYGTLYINSQAKRHEH